MSSVPGIRETRTFKFYDPDRADMVTISARVAPGLSADEAFAIAKRNYDLRGWLEDSTVQAWMTHLCDHLGRKTALRYVHTFIMIPMYRQDSTHEQKQDRFIRLAKALMVDPPAWVDRLVKR